MLHAALHVQMSGDPSPPELMGRLNRVLHDSTSSEQFATFFFGVYDRKNRRFRFTNGGHNFPVLFRSGGGLEYLTAGGIVLGFAPNVTYDQGTTAVEEGDLLVIYSDGVTEETRDDEEQFGEERLVDVVRRHRGEPAEAIVDAVKREVELFAGRDRFSDDFTLIVLRCGGGAA